MFPFVDPHDTTGRGPELAANTSTTYRYVSSYDHAIDWEKSPRDPDWTPPPDSPQARRPLLYMRTGDPEDIVTRTVQGPDGSEWGPVWFTVRAVSQMELRAIRGQLTQRDPGRAYADMCRELFRVGVLAVSGMRVPARKPNGEIARHSNGDPRFEPVFLERESTVGGYDRMTDRFYAYFESPIGERVRIEIGQRIYMLSTANDEHLGNLSGRTSSDRESSVDGDLSAPPATNDPTSETPTDADLRPTGI